MEDINTGEIVVTEENGVYVITKTASYDLLPDCSEEDNANTKENAITYIAMDIYADFQSEHGLMGNYEDDEDDGHCVAHMVVETVVNAEKRGNLYHVDKKIVVRSSLEDAIVRVKVEDEGRGFDWKHLVTAHRLAAGRSYNDFRDDVLPDSQGFGLFHMIDYCDSVKWNKKGNIITLEKKLVKY